ncbi:hypothetical protein ASZ90_019799 [hydrocarbon metagenome]|uniref:Uncharacterized protein n=1 Tax=hydrocarbon metagenome TaxID=938273 RepID=A0A0W8E2I3_9ZZZZ
MCSHVRKRIIIYSRQEGVHANRNSSIVLNHSLEVLRLSITKAKLGEKDKLQALKKLAQATAWGQSQ